MNEQFGVQERASPAPSVETRHPSAPSPEGDDTSYTVVGNTVIPHHPSAPSPAGDHTGYTVIGNTVIPHHLVASLTRAAMIVTIFVAVVVLMVSGEVLIVGRWAAAIEAALLLIRRWFGKPRGPAT